MLRTVRTLFAALAGVVAVSSLETQAEPAMGTGTRIAAISGVHEPHQGFALSTTVPSDKLCVDLAQNLAAELGIRVRVICTDPKTGKSKIVAECGYAEAADASEMGSYSKGWLLGGNPYLICVPRPPEQFPAHRIFPDLEELKP